jgi:Mg2+ and Co2+ transporter CorA
VLWSVKLASTDKVTAQNILLYQRLTRVIAQLTDGVEAELQKRMDDLDNRARQSVEKLEQLTPQIGRLSQGLARVERYLAGDLDLALKKASETSRDNLEHAENLKQLLHVLLGNVLESNSQLAFAHEQSLQQASQRVNDDMGALMAVVSTAIASSTSLQRQIVSLSSIILVLQLAANIHSNSPTNRLPRSPNAKIPSSKAWTAWSRRPRSCPPS